MELEHKPLNLSDEFRKTLPKWQLEIVDYWNSKFKNHKD